MERFEKYMDHAVELAMVYIPKLVLAILTLWIGLMLIGWLVKIIRKNMQKTNVDVTLRRFFANVVSWGLKILLFISVISMLGVATTSFVAVLGAIGLAIGLSLQGSLGNLAGGLLVIFFKPYQVEDLIEAQGEIGWVSEIQMFYTIMYTNRKEKIVIPNGAISNGNIKNYSAEGKVRVDIAIGISYDSDIHKAREVLMEVLKSNELVLDEPSPSIAVTELADSSVNLSVRPWCLPENYFRAKWQLIEECKLALDANKITIPFPQMDVYMKKVD